MLRKTPVAPGLSCPAVTPFPSAAAADAPHPAHVQPRRTPDARGLSGINARPVLPTSAADAALRLPAGHVSAHRARRSELHDFPAFHVSASADF